MADLAQPETLQALLEGCEPPPLPALPILSQPPGVAFATRGVSPPSALYLSPDDYLYVTMWSGASNITFVLRGRLLRADGYVSHFVSNLIPTADRLPSTLEVKLGEGFLLNVSMCQI